MLRFLFLFRMLAWAAPTLSLLTAGTSRAAGPAGRGTSSGDAPAAVAMTLSARLPGSKLKDFPMEITRMEAVSTARGALAEVVVTLELVVAPPPEVRDWNTEGRIHFSPAAGWDITGAALDIGEEMRPASLAPAARAAAAYQEVVHRNIDPCLIRQEPDGRVRVNVFPITRSKPRRLRLEFSRLLEADGVMLRADFPLRFSKPVPEAVLTTNFDPDKAQVTITVRDFAGGAAAALVQPLPAAPPSGPDQTPEAETIWLAEPDGMGGRFFQGLLPADPLSAPREVLLLADVSLLRKTADRATERGLIAGLLRRMGSGRVTLVPFSTLPDSPAVYEVVNGECPALLAALEALPSSGAPRPGAVDVAGRPADLVVILSSLADPLGSGGWPELPGGVPLVVIDNVSPQPSAAARLLAETSGGSLPGRGSEIIPAAPAPLDLKGDFPPGTIVRVLPGGRFRLVAGRMPDKTDRLPSSGSRPEIRPGNDATAGRLLEAFAGRQELRHLLGSQAWFDWSSPPPVVRYFPLLTPGASMIVLEDARDYTHHGIVPPPGMTLPKEEYSVPDPGDQAVVSAALKRPPGSAGDDPAWPASLSGWKHDVTTSRQRRMDTFRKATPVPGSLGITPAFMKVLVQFGITQEGVTAAETAGAILPQLAREYPGADDGKAAALLRQAREIQIDRLSFFEDWYTITEAMFKSGPRTSPAISPFTTTSLVDSLPPDFLGKGSSGAEPFSGEAEPFASGDEAGNGSSNSSDAPPPGSAGKVLEEKGDFQSAAAGVKNARDAVMAAILHQASDLQQSGDFPGAVRLLSELILSKPTHGTYRLLAWQLLEWNQPALAIEVLRRARQLFGENDTTCRDLALALRDSGRPEAAEVLLWRVSGGVAARERMALRQSPDFPRGLRIVMECAGPGADADLEIEGPEDERAYWRHPLPAFGGALSFDGMGFVPEDYLLAAAPGAPFPPFPLRIIIRLHSQKPAAVRVRIYEDWGAAHPACRTILLPQCPPGPTVAAELPAAQ